MLLSTSLSMQLLLIGNLLTFATADLSAAVTLQVTEHTRFETYIEMYRRFGTAAFGFPDKTAEDCAKATEAFLAEYSPEGPLALSVRKLPIPVLHKPDFQKNKVYLLQSYLRHTTR